MRLPGLKALSTMIHLVRRLPLLLAVLLMVACAPLPGPDRAGTFPLLQDGNARPGVKRAIVAIPGAFASANIFAPVLDWEVPDSTVIVYRFPDMDGLPLDHRVQIDGSAQLIADYVNDLGAQEVYLLGYSTGGPIAIETAQRIEAPEVSLALISTAGPAPAGILSSMRSGVEVVRAMLRTGSLRPRDAWTENYRTLLYGDEGLNDPARARDSAARAEAQRENMSTPSLRRTFAHNPQPDVLDPGSARRVGKCPCSPLSWRCGHCFHPRHGPPAGVPPSGGSDYLLSGTGPSALRDLTAALRRHP